MISFYPGPSKVYPEIEKYLQDAFREGILSQNHRSQPFMDLMRETIELLHEKLNIPKDFSIFFTSSATECWEIISQSLVEKSSFHIFNGAFGEKWFEYSKKITQKSGFSKFELQNEFTIFEKLDFDADVWCFTQNETSNGTQMALDFLNYTNHKNLTAIACRTSL